MTARTFDLLMLLILLALVALGCRSVTYTDPTGRKLEVSNFAFDTKFGKLSVKTPEGGEMTLENWDSTEKLADTIKTLADKVPSPLP